MKSFGQMFVRILLHQMKEEKLMTQEELEFRRRCPYDAFGDYSDVLKEIRQKEKLTTLGSDPMKKK